MSEVTHDYHLFRQNIEDYTGLPHRIVLSKLEDCDIDTAHASDARFDGPCAEFPYRCICGHPIAKPFAFVHTDPAGDRHPFLVGSVCITNFAKAEPKCSKVMVAAIYNTCLAEGCDVLIDKEKKVKHECTRYYCPKHRVGHSKITCTRCGEPTPFERLKKTTCVNCYPKECRRKRNLLRLPPGATGCSECGIQIDPRYDMCYSCRFPGRCVGCGKAIKEGYTTCYGCR